MRGSADFHSAVAACLGLNIARRLHICEGPGLSPWSIQWQNPVLFSTARTRAEVATHSLISKGAINDQLMISLLLELVLPLKLADWNWLRCSTHILCLEKWNAATLPPPLSFSFYRIALSLFTQSAVVIGHLMHNIASYLRAASR